MGIWPIGDGTGLLTSKTSIHLPINSTRANRLLSSDHEITEAKSAGSKAIVFRAKKGEALFEYTCPIRGLPTGDLIESAAVALDGKGITVTIQAYSDRKVGDRQIEAGDMYTQTWKLVADKPQK